MVEVEADARDLLEVRRVLAPYRWGPGRLPPYLAGREREQALFRTWGGAVSQGTPPPSAVILHGPRGNGKTALLVWLQRHLESIPGVEVVEMTPAEMRTPTELAEQLLLPTLRVDGARPPATVEEVIRFRASKRPLALLLDEAHTLSPEVGRELLDAGLRAGAELPFLFVLAGTPDLEDRLSEIHRSFWGQAKVIRVNRLEPAAAAAAIERPLRDEGRSIEAAAPERIVRESDGYPWFLQLWGCCSWAHLATRRAITRDEVEAAGPEFEERRADYFRLRYNEFEKRQLLPAARAVAEAFVGVSSLPYAEVEAAIRGALGRSDAANDTAGAMTAMRHPGFVRRAGPAPVLEPGPRLMDYIREHVPES